MLEVIKETRSFALGLPAALAAGVLCGCLLSCQEGASPTSPSRAEESALVAEPESLPTLTPVRLRSTRVVGSRAAAAPVLQGLWGGNGVGVLISSSGASVEFDCAAGEIDEPFLTDVSGHFDLAGTTWFTPPVVSAGWQPDKLPARYVGVVTGDTIILSVVGGMISDTKFTLTRGALPRLVRCA